MAFTKDYANWETLGRPAQRFDVEVFDFNEDEGGQVRTTRASFSDQDQAEVWLQTSLTDTAPFGNGLAYRMSEVEFDDDRYGTVTDVDVEQVGSLYCEYEGCWDVDGEWEPPAPVPCVSGSVGIEE